MENIENNMTSEQQNAEQSVITRQPELGMKWFKYLIYFAFFFSALTDLFDGIIYLTGIGDKLPAIIADEYYFLPDNFRALEVVFGLLILAMAGFGIYTRFQLSGFKKNAPKQFYAFDIISSVISTAYSIAGMVLTTKAEISMIIGVVIGSVVGETFYIMCNITYFNNRKHLFVN